MQTGKITSASVDMAFTKARAAGGDPRVIDYAHFTDALRTLAVEREPAGTPPAAALASLTAQLVAKGGPGTSGAVEARTDGVFAKLTDTSLYTGAHKARFDADGHGVGGELVATSGAPTLPSLVHR